MQATVLSPAKVNLFLKLVGMREDGYHELLTVFQTISLADTLHIELDRAGIRLDAPMYLPQAADNLVYKAAQLYYKAIGETPAVSIRLIKRIPTEAGLGGGSSNAAVVLRALNALYNQRLDENAIFVLARQLGSDVPFFLRGGTALGRGRGDILEDWPEPRRFWLRLVKPPFGLSTPLVFKTWRGRSTADWGQFRQSLDDPSSPPKLFNDLEEPAVTLRSDILEIKTALRMDGANAAVLSGSGSVVYGIYANRPTHELGLPEGYQQWVARTLSRAEFDEGFYMGRESD